MSIVVVASRAPLIASSKFSRSSSVSSSEPPVPPSAGFPGSWVTMRWAVAAGSPSGTPSWAWARGVHSSLSEETSLAETLSPAPSSSTLWPSTSPSARTSFSSSSEVFTPAAGPAEEDFSDLPPLVFSASLPPESEPPQAVASRARQAAEAARAVRRTAVDRIVCSFCSADGLRRRRPEGVSGTGPPQVPVTGQL